MKDTSAEGLLTGFLIRERNSLVAKYVKGKNLIDVGCERGSLPAFLPRGIGYTGADILPKEKFSPKFRYLKASIEKGLGKKENGKYDCVVMAAVIEHLSKPDSAIRNCGSLLKPGGRLILTTPTKTGDSLHKTISRIGLVSLDAAEGHQHIFTMEELTGLFEKSGFSVTESKTFQFGMNQLVVGEKK